MAAVQPGDRDALARVLRQQRAHLLKELRGLAEARTRDQSKVVELLIIAAELHIRADLGVVDAAEQSLEAEVAAAAVNSAKAPAAAGSPASATSVAKPAAS